jgi:hypothetical protein
MNDNHLNKEQARVFSSALAVAHPSLDAYRVTAIVVKGLSTPEPGSIAGSKVIRIRCLQYMPPTTKTAPSKVTKAHRSNRPAPEAQERGRRRAVEGHRAEGAEGAARRARPECSRARTASR